MGFKIGGDAMGMQLRSWWQKIKQHPFCHLSGKMYFFLKTCHEALRPPRIGSLTYYGVAAWGALFLLSTPHHRQIPHLVRQRYGKSAKKCQKKVAFLGAIQTLMLPGAG